MKLGPGLVAVVVAGLVVVAVPEPATAAFPGANGVVVFQRFDAFGGGIGDVYTVNVAGTVETNLTGTGAVEDRDPAWSADGGTIAFRRGGAGVDQLWVMDAAGGSVVVVPGSGTASAPAWSPDGTQLVYECWGAGSTDLCVRHVDGSGFVQLTATAGISETGPVWSPDGTRIVYGRSVGSGSNLISLDVATLATTALTVPVAGTYDGRPDFSPDGAQLAFTRFVGGSGHGGAIYRMPSTGGRFALVTQPRAGSDSHHTMPAWSPDGTKIAYCDLDDDEAWGHIFTINPDGTGRAQLTVGVTTDETPDWRPVTGRG